MNRKQNRKKPPQIVQTKATNDTPLPLKFYPLQTALSETGRQTLFLIRVFASFILLLLRRPNSSSMYARMTKPVHSTTNQNGLKWPSSSSLSLHIIHCLLVLHFEPLRDCSNHISANISTDLFVFVGPRNLNSKHDRLFLTIFFLHWRCGLSVAMADKKVEKKFIAALSRFHAAVASFMNNDNESATVNSEDDMIVIALNGGVSSGGVPFYIRSLCKSAWESTNSSPTMTACSANVAVQFSAVQPHALVTIRSKEWEGDVVGKIAALLKFIVTRHPPLSKDSKRTLSRVFELQAASDGQGSDDETASQPSRHTSTYTTMASTAIIGSRWEIRSLECVETFLKCATSKCSSVFGVVLDLGGLQEHFPVFSSAASSSGVIPPLALLFVPFGFHRLSSAHRSIVLGSCGGASQGHWLLPILRSLTAMPVVVPEGTQQTPSRGRLSVSQEVELTLEVRSIAAVPGAFVVPNFLSDEEHDAIFSLLVNDAAASHTAPNSSIFEWEALARRSVAHFNRRFYYGVNRLGGANENLGKNSETPDFYGVLRERLMTGSNRAVTAGGVHYAASLVADGVVWPVPSDFDIDQLTINYYRYSRPGPTTTSMAKTVSGIAHHVDAHSPFGDIIFAVSLGSHTVMEFKRWDEETSSVGVYLPPRSLLMMTGEARYAWTHCISENRVDMIRDDMPPMVRTDRISLTWRQGRVTPHTKATCVCPALCDAVVEIDSHELKIAH